MPTKKIKSGISAIAFILSGFVGGSVIDSIGAKTIDHRANVQIVLSEYSKNQILEVVEREGLPGCREDHTSSCKLTDLEESRFDLFEDGAIRSMRMHARFKVKLKAK